MKTNQIEREASAVSLPKKKSLTAKTLRSTVLAAVALGLVALVIGTGMYGYTIFNQYTRRAFETTRNASVSASHGADAVGFSKKVMGIYRALTLEQRSQMGTEAYRKFFTEQPDVMAMAGTYDLLQHMLSGYMIDVDYIYLAMFDEATRAMIYLVDTDPQDPFSAGEWETVDEQGMRKFLDWNGEGILYDVDQTPGYGWMCTAGYPIHDASGKTCAFLLVDISMNSVITSMARFALQIGLALALATAMIAWRVSRKIKASVVQPVDAIANAAVRYVQDKQRNAPNQNHFDSLGIRTGDELENLSRIMAEMERDLTDHEAQLKRITAQEERMVTELSLATRIQASMLPHVFPPFPERTDFDIYASMDPAREVGGDFYDYFLIDDDHLGLVMADVSGKGVPAALFMMASKIILQSVAMLGGSPAEILTKANEAICSNNEIEMFVTVWIGILELSTGRLTAANAGHEYPMLKRPGQPFELYKDRHGFVVGGMAGVRYREYELQLEPGSKLFLYTDGVPEATSAAQELFGTERLVAALNKDPEASPVDVLKNVRAAVDGFVRDAEQFDDLTMLCLEYRGAPSAV